MLETLVPDAWKRVCLAREDGRLEARRLQSRPRATGSQECEEREDEPPAGHEVSRSARDEPIEDVPAIHPAIVGSRRRIVAFAPGRCRHLGWARADEMEAPTG